MMQDSANAPGPSTAAPRPDLPGIFTTYLEMHSPEELRPKRIDDPKFFVREARVRQWMVNRFFYQLVGGPWQWRDKLNWSDEQWRAYAEDDRLRTWVAHYDGSPAGYFELRQDDDHGVQIAYFGLAPAFIGRGLGGALLTVCLEEAWAMAPRRVWVHTCTLDHPGAVPNYQARGMKTCKVEPGAH